MSNHAAPHPMWLLLGTVHDTYAMVRHYNLENPGDRIPESYTIHLTTAAAAARLRGLGDRLHIVACPTFYVHVERDAIRAAVEDAATGRDAYWYGWTHDPGPTSPWELRPIPPVSPLVAAGRG